MSTPLPILPQIAKEAGDEILRLQPQVVANEHGEQKTKPDKSLVTIADKKANEIVCEGLRRHFPGIAIVSEENPEADNAQALLAEERFDTDPLDNTSAYAKGRDTFSVNIGGIKNGIPIEGVVYFPARKELYFTDGNRAWLQKDDAAPVEIRVRQLPLRDPLQIAVGFSEQNIPDLGGRPYKLKRYAAQLRTCMVAAGDCDLTGISKGIIDGYNCWDIAGAHAVLRQAGGELVDEQGEPIRYRSDTVKVAGHLAGGINILVALELGNPASLLAASSSFMAGG